jgi:signal transduction histidine kinase
MKTRSIIVYWLLLLVPTVAIAVAAFHVLSREQERITHETTAAARDRARAIAENLSASISNMKDDFTDALREIPDGSELQTLSQWERTNPLVRNVFLWKPGIGLQYPESGTGATADEKRFVARYDALFSGRIPWWATDSDTPFSGRPSLDVSGGQQASVQAQKTSPSKSLLGDVRQQKLDIRRQGYREQAGQTEQGRVDASSAQDAKRLCGWIPWFAENRLYILGWVRRDVTGLMYGVELELMAVLSRVVADFPDSAPEGMVYALVDGEGKSLHQVGKADVKPAKEPDMAVSLAPHFPHWQVAVFFVDDGSAARSSHGFIILSGLLLVIFVVTVVAGGTLLTRQAHRNMIDAQQKTTFVSHVSHELKTPLTSIRMYAELLSEERVKDEDKRRRYLQVIVAESQRLTRLVNNVLDFSRLEQGSKKYLHEEFDVARYTRELVDTFSLRVREAGLTLQVHLPSQPVLVRADRDAFEQVLLNLVDNAIKYAADGGELGVNLDLHGDQCAVRIMDRGPGVPVEHRDRIFDKFHRVDDSLTSRQQGTGLGLSIGRRIARDLGGDLLYEPRQGGGSCFVFVIPLYREAS